MYPDPNNVQPQQPVQQPQPMPTQPAQYQPQPVAMAPQPQPVPYPTQPQPQPMPVQPQQQYYAQPQQPAPGYALQPQQYATYPQAVPAGMGLDMIIGLASLVIGGLALILSWIPIAGIILSLIAIGLGVAGIILIKKKGGKLWSAISGAGAGGVALIVAIVLLAIGGVDYAEYNRLCQEEKSGTFSRYEGSAKSKVTVTCKNGAVDRVEKN